MSFAPREYLRHILAEADYLVTHSRDLTPETFQADETLRRAFVRSLEIIGVLPGFEWVPRGPKIPLALNFRWWLPAGLRLLSEAATDASHQTGV